MGHFQKDRGSDSMIAWLLLLVIGIIALVVALMAYWVRMILGKPKLTIKFETDAIFLPLTS